MEKLHNDPEIDVVLIDSPEEDVDISDEAQSFRPHKVSREEPKKEEEKKEESEAQSDADASQEGKEESDDERSNQTTQKKHPMKLNWTPNRTKLLLNLRMMKRPRNLLKKQSLKNLLMNKHPKKATMMPMMKNTLKVTTTPSAHRATAKPS